jgi:hypothetical protein
VRFLHRLFLYVGVTVVFLLVLPLVVPPDPHVEYEIPAWSSTTRFVYGPSAEFGGPVLTHSASWTLEVVTWNVSGMLIQAGLRTMVTGASTPPWPILAWGEEFGSGGWDELTLACPGGGSSTVNLTTPLEIGLRFPLTDAGFSTRESAPGLGSGDCLNGPVTVTTVGGYQAVIPSGGFHCVLYDCPTSRTYTMDVELSVVSLSGPDLWEGRFLGVYDPLISGWRYLSYSPGNGTGFSPGSENFTLYSDLSAPSAVVPTPYLGLLESTLTVLAVPLGSLGLEIGLARRQLRREERERERLLRTLLPPDRGSPPPEEPGEEGGL